MKMPSWLNVLPKLPTAARGPAIMKQTPMGVKLQLTWNIIDEMARQAEPEEKIIPNVSSMRQNGQRVAYLFRIQQLLWLILRHNNHNNAIGLAYM